MTENLELFGPLTDVESACAAAGFDAVLAELPDGGDTVLGPGTRLDNLVQIGHNVKTGRGCVIVAQVGIAGSVELGDYVVVAAQAGLAGHIKIGAQARIGAQAGVMNDVPAATDVVGSPAWPARETLRAFARLRQLAATKKDGTSGGTP